MGMIVKQMLSQLLHEIVMDVQTGGSTVPEVASINA